MKLFVALMLAFPCVSAVAQAGSPEHVQGRYVSKEGDHGIELLLKDGVLMGRIAWTKDPELTDAQNEDPALRSRKVAGIYHAQGFEQDGHGRWAGGTLYNPEDGKTYAAALWLEGDERLIIQGRPNVPLLGGLLGALFGRIVYARETVPTTP